MANVDVPNPRLPQFGQAAGLNGGISADVYEQFAPQMATTAFRQDDMVRSYQLDKDIFEEGQAQLDAKIAQSKRAEALRQAGQDKLDKKAEKAQEELEQQQQQAQQQQAEAQMKADRERLELELTEKQKDRDNAIKIALIQSEGAEAAQQVTQSKNIRDFTTKLKDLNIKSLAQQEVVRANKADEAIKKDQIKAKAQADSLKARTDNNKIRSAEKIAKNKPKA